MKKTFFAFVISFSLLSFVGCQSLKQKSGSYVPFLTPEQSRELGALMEADYINYNHPDSNALQLTTDTKLLGEFTLDSGSNTKYHWTLKSDTWKISAVKSREFPQSTIKIYDDKKGFVITPTLLSTLSADTAICPMELTLESTSDSSKTKTCYFDLAFNNTIPTPSDETSWVTGPSSINIAHYGDQSTLITWSILTDTQSESPIASPNPTTPAKSTSVGKYTLTEYTYPISELKQNKEITFKVISASDKTIRQSETIPISSGGVAITYQMIDQLNAEKHFGKAFANFFYCVDVTFYNWSGNAAKIDAGSINIWVNYISKVKRDEMLPTGSELQARLGSDAESLRHYNLQSAQNDTFIIWKELHNPMDYNALLDTISYDQWHNPRSLFIRLLRRAGVIASAAGVFVDGEDYAKITSFVQGPITEQLAEELLHDLTRNLSYINDNAVHESFIIGADTLSIKKCMFFPKTDFFGRWGMELPLRIMDIDDNKEYEPINALIIKETDKSIAGN